MVSCLLEWLKKMAKSMMLYASAVKGVKGPEYSWRTTGLQSLLEGWGSWVLLLVLRMTATE